MSEEWETHEGLLVAPVTKQKQMQNARTFMRQSRKKQTTAIPQTNIEGVMGPRKRPIMEIIDRL